MLNETQAMAEEISCAITGQTAATLEPGDFLVSLDDENTENGLPRHYYSYSFLLEWYIQQYQKGHSLLTLNTQFPLKPPRSQIIPASSIKVIDKFHYAILAFLMTYMFYLLFSIDKSCDNFSEKLSSFTERKAAAFKFYGSVDDALNLGKSISQINTEQEAYISACDEVFKLQSAERSMLESQTVLYFSVMLILIAAKAINFFCKKDSAAAVRDWLDARVTRYHPPAERQGLRHRG